MQITDIIRSWGANINNDDNIFECLTSIAPQKCFYIDRFPLLIEHFEKYAQEELYYKKTINNKNLIDLFKKEELKFINIMKKIWLYNTALIQTNLIESLNDINNGPLNGNDLSFRNIEKIIKNSMDNAMIIEGTNQLDLLVKLSVREILYSELVFLEQKILVIAYGMCFQLYVEDLSIIHLLSKIISTEGLYLRPYSNDIV